ncbi:MAG: COG4315 family predicted lipoprotein [Streptosporangiales bacterium]
MRSLHFVPVLAALAALATACGGAGAASSQAASNGPVNTGKVDGVGTVLVDMSGKTLYFAEQETASKVSCTGSCTQFWHPLTTNRSTAPKAGDLQKSLKAVKRPDGKMQLAYAGHPLYTFSQDGGAGNAKGNGFKDSFGGTKFTWHAITPKGVAPSGGSSSGGGGGYGGGY